MWCGLEIFKSVSERGLLNSSLHHNEKDSFKKGLTKIVAHAGGLGTGNFQHSIDEPG